MPIYLEPTPLHLGYEEDEGVRAGIVSAKTFGPRCKGHCTEKSIYTRISFFNNLFIK